MLNDSVVSTPSPDYSTLGLHLGDTFCGLIGVIILVMGLCGNLPAVYIFASDIARKVYVSEKRLCFDSVFLGIAMTDTLICVCMLPVTLSFLDDRLPVFFTNTAFCAIWGVVWSILPYFSVFLVATLSFTRTYTLLRPLGGVRVKHLLAVVLTYLLFLISRSFFPYFFARNTEVKYKYYKDSVLCQEDIVPMNHYWHFKMVANQVQLLLPVFPITISCITSFVVLKKGGKAAQSNTTARMQSEATMTILLVTLLYWVCNVPVAANYLYYHVGTLSFGRDYYDLYVSRFMLYYSWPSTLTLSVGINSLLNPLVYFTRMRRFKGLFTREVNKAKDKLGETISVSMTDAGRRISQMSRRVSSMSGTSSLYRHIATAKETEVGELEELRENDDKC